MCAIYVFVRNIQQLLSKSLEFFMWLSYTKIMWLHKFLDFSSHFMIFHIYFIVIQ
jgi:hypothetical protein